MKQFNYSIDHLTVGLSLDLAVAKSKVYYHLKHECRYYANVLVSMRLFRGIVPYMV